MINSEELYWNERFNEEQRLMTINYQEVAYQAMRPSACYKPKLFKDGNRWCALFGENIQEGVCGFGKSPSEAFENFDKEWNKEIE